MILVGSGEFALMLIAQVFETIALYLLVIARCFDLAINTTKILIKGNASFHSK